jgi:hypothetical protein
MGNEVVGLIWQTLAKEWAKEIHVNRLHIRKKISIQLMINKKLGGSSTTW